MSTAIGGQAVLEGVMMRSPSSWAVAVRKPDGKIAQVVNEIASPMAKRRIFQYHAAEHKAINCYEAGDELTPENVQRHSLIHVRCGTAFLLWVMVIAIFVFAFFGHPVWYWLIATRILLLPLIAGLAYELIRFAGKHSGNRILMTLLAPGLWLQRLTTREPTLDQIEVSIHALKEVLRFERSETS